MHAHHSDDKTLALKEVNQLALVRRLRAAEQTRAHNRLELLLGTKIIKLAPSVALARKVLVLAKDADLPANRLRGALVVASDANNTDACGLALRNRVAHLGARRVEHADERHEREVLLEARVAGRRLGLVVLGVERLVLSVGKGERAQALGAVRDRALEERVAQLGDHRDRAAVDEDGGAALEDGLGGALGEEHAGAVLAREDGHHLAVARELEGQNTGDCALVEVVHGVGAGGRVEVRQVLRKLGIGAGELLSEHLQCRLSGLAEVGVCLLVLW